MLFSHQPEIAEPQITQVPDLRQHGLPGRDISLNAQVLADSVIHAPNQETFRNQIKAIVKNGGEDSLQALAAIIFELSNPQSHLSNLLHDREPEIVAYRLCSAVLKVAGTKNLQMWSDVRLEQSLSTALKDEAQDFMHALARGEYANLDFIRGSRIVLAETCFGSSVGRFFFNIAEAATSRFRDQNDSGLFLLMADLPWILTSPVPWACSSREIPRS